MKTKVYSILKYNPYTSTYLDVFSNSNYRLILTQYFSLVSIYKNDTFILVEVKEC